MQISFEIADKKISLGLEVEEAHAATCGTAGTYSASDNGRESCTYTTAGPETFTPPAGVTSIHVAAWGSGGGGFDGSSSGGGKGGGGGAFASTTITVVPSTSYNLTVGDGGTEATAGTDSLFNTDDIIADGGAGGTSATTGGGTGGSLANTSCNGSDCAVEYPGGTGGDGYNGSTDEGGGGGGSAGPHGDGGNGAAGNTTLGSGGGGGGGNGGNDATNATGASSTKGGAGGDGSEGSEGNGFPGTSHANGGGGGGGGDDDDGGGNGGAPGGGGGGGETCNAGTECQGANGKIYIIWSTPPSITVDEPDGTNDTVTAGQNYTVQYDLSDSVETVTADFYYDTDSSGTNGTAIAGCQDKAEGTNQTCTWDTIGVTPGTYYVYGVTNDGINADVSDYSPEQVTILAADISISGTLYSDEGTSPVTSGKTISMYMATSTGSVATSTTSNGSGVFSFAGLDQPPTAGVPATLWVDADTSFRASAVTVASSTSNNITGLDLYQNRVIVKHESESATSTTIAKLGLYDSDNDSDIQFSVDGSNNLAVKAGQMLYIWPGTHFDTLLESGGTITLHGGVSGDIDGDIALAKGFHPASPSVATSSILTLGNSLSLSGSWFASSTSILNHNSQTITFTATTTGKSLYASSTPFYNLTFDGVDGTSGGWTFREMASTTNNFTITDGTVTAPPWLSIAGNFTNNGTFTGGTGTTTFNGTTAQTLSGTMTGLSVFNNVEFNNSFSGGASEDWYHEDWLYRKKITLKQASTTLTDFPALISLSDTDLASNAQSDGDDILFTTSDGITKLPHELEASSTVIFIRVNSSSDDAEEFNDVDGTMSLDSSDLELISDAGEDQQVGMVFDGVSLPQGSVIRSAYIQFTTDETSSDTTNLTVYGEDTDTASTFTTTAGNIRNRTKTNASVAWDNVPAWDELQEDGGDQLTPDLSAIVQEIVDRPGWARGNSMGFILTGSGSRTAEAYDGSTSEAPLLIVEWADPHDGGVNAWVNIPTLSSSAPTDIYMYYGNSATSSEELPSQVWDSNYVAVYHFGQEIAGIDDGEYLDSSVNDHGGWDFVGDGNSKAGKVGNGQQFGHSTVANADWIGSDEDADFLFAANDHVFEGWFKAEEQVSSSGFGILFSHFTGGAPGQGYFIAVRDSNSTLGLDYRADGGDSLALTSSNSIYEDNNWHYFAISIDVSEKLGTLYIDGNYHDDDTYTGNLIDKTGYPESSYFMSAVGWDSPDAHELLGSLDEVRFTNGSARTDDWFTIGYDNITATSTFYTAISSKETDSGSGVGITLSNNASTTHMMILQGGIQAPPLLSIAGNFGNQANFEANSGTTTFKGTSQQYISGFATGTNAFAGLEFLNTTASTTFTVAASSTGMMTAVPSARIEFKSGATTTVQNISFAGSSGNEIYLHPSTPVEEASWDLINASNDNITYDITGQGGTGSVSTGIAFKSDGTKMYQLDAGTDSVYQYSLSPAWDISTLSYDTVSFSVTDQDKNPTDIAFKSDGTKMYIIGLTGDKVYEYPLSSAWNLSTASYNNASTSISSQEGTGQGLAFKTDGTKLYIVGTSNDSVFQYSLSPAWDITSASYDTVSLSVVNEDSLSQGIAFKTDGTKLFMVGALNDEVHQYSLSSAWDLSTALYDEVLLDVNPPESEPRGLAFKPDGTKLFLLGEIDNDTLYQYSLTGARWGLEVPGGRSVSYVNVKDSNACYVAGNDISASNSTDGGNNDCWDIAAPVEAGTLTIEDHDAGQESNKFLTNTLIDEEFFNFKLIPATEAITITPVFSISAFGIGQSDITNAQLFADSDANGNVNGAEGSSPLGGSGSVALSGISGTITFSSFSISTASNYILQADIANVVPGTELSVSLNKSKITATGDDSAQSITPTGTAVIANHIRSGGGSTGGSPHIDTVESSDQTGGGGGGGEQSGDPPPPPPDEGGGGGGGGGRSMLPPGWFIPYNLFASVIKQIDTRHVFEWFQ